MTKLSGSENEPTRLATVIQAKRAELGVTPDEPTRLSACMPRLTISQSCESETQPIAQKPPWPTRPWSPEQIDAMSTYYHDLERYETPASRWAACGIDNRSRAVAEQLGSTPDEQRTTAWWLTFERLRAALGTGMLVGLVGPFGSGKTVMAAMLLRAACDAAMKRPTFTTAPAMFRALHAARDEGREDAIISDYRRMSLLIIDEAHERANTDYEDRRLGEIINLRYGRSLDTVLVTNMQPAEFAKQIGGAVVDRMRQCGGIIPCNWPSFRANPAAISTSQPPA